MENLLNFTSLFLFVPFSRLVLCILLFIFQFSFLYFYLLTFNGFFSFEKCCHCRASWFKSVLHCMHSHRLVSEAFLEALHLILFFLFVLCLDELWHLCRGTAYKTITFFIPESRMGKRIKRKRKQILNYYHVVSFLGIVTK